MKQIATDSNSDSSSSEPRSWLTALISPTRRASSDTNLRNASSEALNGQEKSDRPASQLNKVSAAELA